MLQLLFGNKYILQFLLGIFFFVQLLSGNAYILSGFKGEYLFSFSFYWCGCESSWNSYRAGNSARVLPAYEYSDD